MPPHGDVLAVDCTTLIPMEVSGKEPWSWADHILLGHTWNLEHRHAGLRSRTTQRFHLSLFLVTHPAATHLLWTPVPTSPPWKSPVTLIPFSFLKQLMFGKPLFIYKVTPSTAYSKVLVCLFASPWLGQGCVSLFG